LRRGSRRRRVIIASTCAGVVALVVLGFAVAGGMLGGEGTRDPRVFDAQTPGVVRLITAMREDSEGGVYDALSRPARGTMDRAEFLRAYRAQRARTGKVKRVSVRAPFRSRDTAEGALGAAVMRIGYERTPARDYDAYFLFENSDWRFWFTAPTRGKARR